MSTIFLGRRVRKESTVRRLSLSWDEPGDPDDYEGDPDEDEGNDEEDEEDDEEEEGTWQVRPTPPRVA